MTTVIMIVSMSFNLLAACVIVIFFYKIKSHKEQQTSFILNNKKVSKKPDAPGTNFLKPLIDKAYQNNKQAYQDGEEDA